MQKLCLFVAAIASLATPYGSYAADPLGLKPQPDNVPEPGLESTWSVWTCPDTRVCTVTVLVDDNCKFERPDLIDRHKKRPVQIIRWEIKHADTAKIARFSATNGIKGRQQVGAEFKDEALGAGESANRFNRKRVTQRPGTDSLITYDINVIVGSGPGTSCKPDGPAIISRG